ncbi:MAG: hypothetical protein LBS67_00730 [Clostridiales Family XIII bacterium]|jgi:hypothetical protein|nr:hypothetical protein [Clostridiales Family XIII bacterium]
MAKTKKNKELNLLTALDRGKRRKKAGTGAVVVIALIVIVVAAVAFFFLHTYRETEALTERRDLATAYVEDPEIQAQYNASLADQQEASVARVNSQALAGAVEAINSYPDMTSADFKKLFAIAEGKVDMTNIMYDRTSGILSFNGSCGSATRIPIFIADLRASGAFSDVNYSGYAGGMTTIPGEPQTTTDGSIIETQITVAEYTFSVTCLVNTDEEREIFKEKAAEEKAKKKETSE